MPSSTSTPTPAPVATLTPTPIVTSNPTPTPTLVPVETEKPILSPSFTVENQDSYADITNNGEEQTVTVIIAEYDGSVLKSVNAANITFAKNEKRTFMLGSGKHKIFIWDSLNGMKPLA